MELGDWINLLNKIDKGELDLVHPTFPNPQIFGMKVTRTGVNMLITQQEYGSELGLLEVDILFENSESVNVTSDEAIEAYNRLMEYEKDTYVPEPTPKPKEKNVAKLFSRKRGK